ncbi:MAG TPA: phage tail sheath C-terminal domain-containing protein, partial [Tepidiformaceae bacterium]|nr:phage tail sheath C-terminal domain-containing protein [Tepidiformaceae bacterium]
NEVIRGVISLPINLTSVEQSVLNPNGVNCLRVFAGRGIRVWGARTLSSDPSWRYLNVRRLFNFVEKSIERGTQWAVFEPNDQLLWSKIRRDIGAFLGNVYRNGALFGATPAQAFFVKCDAENNPQATRDLGQLIVDIGIAPVKPAEFVIFRISQYSPEE